MVKDIGAAGENIFHARARRLGYEVEWLTHRAEFWDKDCDFLVFSGTGNENLWNRDTFSAFIRESYVNKRAVILRI